MGTTAGDEAGAGECMTSYVGVGASLSSVYTAGSQVGDFFWSGLSVELMSCRCNDPHGPRRGKTWFNLCS